MEIFFLIITFFVAFIILLHIFGLLIGKNYSLDNLLEKQNRNSFLGSLAMFFENILPLSVKNYEKKCIQSGFSNVKSKAHALVLLKVILPFILLYGLIQYTGVREHLLIFKIIEVTIAVLLGYFLSDMFLYLTIKRYRSKLMKGLNSVIDIVLICYEAGYSSEYVMNRIQHDLREFYPEISNEFYITSNELKLFSDRKRAWQNLGERTGIEEIKVLTNALQLSEELGAGISYSLKNQISVLRKKRLSKAEERAGRVPEFMVLTNIVFMVTPALIFIIGPVVLRLLIQVGIVR